VLELEGAARRSGEESEGAGAPSPEAWAARCEEQAAAIVQLWDMCNVSLFHRTQFYRLFSTATLSDHVYLEVEQRRLEWLREQCLLTLEDGHEEPRAIRGSLKRLRYERYAPCAWAWNRHGKHQGSSVLVMSSERGSGIRCTINPTSDFTWMQKDSRKWADCLQCLTLAVLVQGRSGSAHAATPE
jgi:hypothetical protein